MKDENIIVTYLLTFQIESARRSIDLLLAEMTSGIQYVSTQNGVKMDPVKDTVPFIDNSVYGNVVTISKTDEDAYLVKYSLPSSNLDVSLGGISNLWPMVAGEVFNFHFVKRAELQELELPASFEGYYRDPVMEQRG